MKNLTSKIVTTALIIAMLSTNALAYTQASQELVIETNQILGIMNGDENGNMNLHKPVTRAEFSKMMVSASIFKDTSGSAQYSLFTDVSANHWASGYIKTSVEQGWFIGYVDGTFRPNGYITLEAGATTALRMLGYYDLEGSYPSAQLEKFYELNLDTGITAVQGQNLSRNDCANLFYNMMNAKTSNGMIYAQTLGYPVTSSGTIDTLKLQSILTDGPYVYTEIQNLPFEITQNTVIYKNNQIIEQHQISMNDVCYYNEDANKVWVYDDTATGRISMIDSLVAPSKITVAGVTYGFETQEASKKLTSGAEFKEGDVVTLLLGESGMIVDIINPSSSNNEVRGVVLSNGITEYDGFTEESITIVTLDGDVQTHGSDGKSYNKNDLVTIEYTDKGEEINKIRQKSIEGRVSSDGSKVGSYEFSEDVVILEVSDEDYGMCYTSRLAGHEIEKDEVIYYNLNEDGEIVELIIEDVTGDLHDYAIITNAFTSQTSNSMSFQSSYQYVLNGMPNIHNIQNTDYNIDEGGAKIAYDNGRIESMDNLAFTTIKSLSDLTAVTNAGEFTLADNVSIYEEIDDKYYLVSKDSISDTSKYKLTAYYDDFGYSAGGQIRIIVAEAK